MMSKHQQSPRIQWLLLCFTIAKLFHFCHGEVGTASQYDPPYSPTACYGNDVSKFPDNNLFGAAGVGIWDNGAACGRKYFVSCLSAYHGKCVAGSIQITIVDRAAHAVSRPSSPGATIVLSATAFASIANPSANKLNIEYQEV